MDSCTLLLTTVLLLVLALSFPWRVLVESELLLGTFDVLRGTRFAQSIRQLKLLRSQIDLILERIALGGSDDMNTLFFSPARLDQIKATGYESGLFDPVQLVEKLEKLNRDIKAKLKPNGWEVRIGPNLLEMQPGCRDLTQDYISIRDDLNRTINESMISIFGALTLLVAVFLAATAIAKVIEVTLSKP